MRMAIMGAGSLGIIIGALTTRAGYQIDLVAASTKTVEALNKEGARVTGFLDMTIPVKALTPNRMEGLYDVIFYLVKTTGNEAALPITAAHLMPSGAVVSMQNGFPEELVAAGVGPERTIGCVVHWGATREGPNISRLTQDPETMIYHLAEMNGKSTERLKKIITVLSAAGRPKIVDNLVATRWNKFGVNATMSALSTVMGGTFGDVLQHPKALRCLAHLGQEVYEVALASGVAPGESAFLRLFDFRSEREMEEKLDAIRKVWNNTEAKASMLQDLQNGRPCEVDTINGELSRRARLIRINTPVNDQVVEIIKKMEAGKLGFSPGNLDLIRLPKLPGR